MIHYTNFGKFGTNLKAYADLEGFIPEEGDELDNFNYPGGWFEEDDLEEWEEHVAEAVAATQKAEDAVKQWLQE